MQTPPSPLASFVRLARDPVAGQAPAFAWHSFERDPVTWSYARTYRAAAAAAAKVSQIVNARGSPPPRLSPLQTSPEHRAHCIGAFVSEGPGLLLLTLAVGLCGFAFVPLSKQDPPTRLAAAMRDAAVSAVVANDDDARLARVLSEALETVHDTTREDNPRSLGTGTSATGVTCEANRGDVADVRRNDGETRRVDVLRLSDLFDVGAFEDGSEDGSERPEETPIADALSGALADLDLDACVERHPDRVSHVFFTSGSTGTPKGCVATRGALAWFAAGKRETHGVDSSSVTLAASPHVFDPSLGDFYASLAAGGRVALCPEAKLVSDLGACLAATRATHLTATPTALGSVVAPSERDGDVDGSAADFFVSGKETKTRRPMFPSLRVVALGGEPTPRALVDAWAGRVPVLANTYGVTECCVYQTFSRIDASDGESRRRLGSGFPGVRMIHAAPPGDDPAVTVDDDAHAGADARGDEPFDAGSSRSRSLAELWLAGPQVGLGYAGDPSLTEARFRVAVGPDGAEERLFRTGDITRRVIGGRVLVGRRDGQVKIRGRRVELGEIECAMRACLSDVVRDVAVTAIGKEGDGGSDGALAAWAVPRRLEDVFDVSDADVSGADESRGDDFHPRSPSATTCDAMRFVLASRLPAYMLPSRFAFVRALPRTASGKTARAALARRPAPPPPDRDSDATRRAFPRRERAVASIAMPVWSRELGVPPHAIARASRFAELGGDSMVAVRICRGVYSATRPTIAANAEDIGAHGEFLTGAFAPARLAGDVSLGTFVSRVAADLRRAGHETCETEDETEDDDEADKTEEDETEDDFSGALERDESVSGSDEGYVSAGVSLLYRAARENVPAVARTLLRCGVPVDGWRDARGAEEARRRKSAGATARNEREREREDEIERSAAPSPLHAACAAGAEATALVFLERGAMPRACTRRGATPLHLAAAAAKPFSVEGLRGVLASADGGDGVRNKTPHARLRFSPISDDRGPRKGPRREGGSTKSSALVRRDDDRQSVLHYAARAGTSAANVEWLIDTAESLRVERKMGAQTASEPFVEWRDVWGRTAMHWAALNGNRGVVTALLRKGASSSVEDAHGDTPVQLAERRALCSARERPDGERASRWGDIATLLGGAGTTKHLKKRLAP